MNPFNVVKNAIALNLEKKGYSLHDLENALSSLNTGEGVLQVTKMASAMANPLGDAVGSGLGYIGSTFLPLTMGIGGLAGLGVDAAEGSVRDQNKRLGELRKSIDVMKKMKQNAEIEHGLNQK